MSDLTFEQKIAKSSQILRAIYQPENLCLLVVFDGTCAEYRYLGVPPAVWEQMQAAESIGSFFHHNVKKAKFTYERLPLNQEEFDSLLAAKIEARKHLPPGDTDEARLRQAH